MANRLNPTNYGDPSARSVATDRIFIHSGTDNQVRSILAIAILGPVTTAQMNALSPAAGWMVWNSDEISPFCYNGTEWINMLDGLPL